MYVDKYPVNKTRKQIIKSKKRARRTKNNIKKIWRNSDIKLALSILDGAINYYNETIKEKRRLKKLNQFK